MITSSVDELDSDKAPVDEVEKEKTLGRLINIGALQSGMHLLRGLLECSNPGDVPEDGLVSAMLDIVSYYLDVVHHNHIFL